ncbi:hypothetical protein CVT26_009673 [Gymnopilus dilepis]|uniref:Uncharacterized protein n=1 Tax=Gymnopilus dilepis TaxID=231916 RepID=A0A409YBL3_9AGAR|nr:hypothetical protein CVT26_009673 [Gymnopilus dilepis]
MDAFGLCFYGVTGKRRNGINGLCVVDPALSTSLHHPSSSSFPLRHRPCPSLQRGWGTHGVGGPPDIIISWRWRRVCPPRATARRGRIVSLPFGNTTTHLPRVEERVGGGLFWLHNPAQVRRPRRRHLPASSSLGKTSRRCGENNHL